MANQPAEPAAITLVELEQVDPAWGLACIVDLETTGFGPGRREIIEVGLLLFAFDREQGTVLGIVDEYHGLREPKGPHDRAAKQVHGITEEELAGQALDECRILETCQRAEVLIAHNATFDQSFLCTMFPVLRPTKWLCSMSGIDWRGKGYGSRRLDDLLAQHEIRPPAHHRSRADCHNVLALLSLSDEAGVPYLKELLGSREVWTMVKAGITTAKGQRCQLTVTPKEVVIRRDYEETTIPREEVSCIWVAEVGQLHEDYGFIRIGRGGENPARTLMELMNDPQTVVFSRSQEAAFLRAKDAIVATDDDSEDTV